jgi:ABC-type Na+ transport system ATPase subunit NatA
MPSPISMRPCPYLAASRSSIARALIRDPLLIVADELTYALYVNLLTNTKKHPGRAERPRCS